MDRLLPKWFFWRRGLRKGTMRSVNQKPALGALGIREHSDHVSKGAERGQADILANSGFENVWHAEM